MTDAPSQRFQVSAACFPLSRGVLNVTKYDTSFSLSRVLYCWGISQAALDLASPTLSSGRPLLRQNYRPQSP